MLKYVNSYIKSSVMKSLKVFHITGDILKKFTLTKLYYWFNK